MKKILAFCVLALAATVISAAPTVTTQGMDGKPVERSQVPPADASTFGIGTGIYGNQGILGGHLQLGFTQSFRMGGSIYGSLLGDQAGTFQASNYWFGWVFSGDLMFISPTAYKGLFRPYTMLELTYAYDAKYKGGNILGVLKIGTEITLNADFGLFIDAGIIAPFQRDTVTTPLSGGVVDVGVNYYF